MVYSIWFGFGEINMSKQEILDTSIRTLCLNMLERLDLHIFAINKVELTLLKNRLNHLDKKLKKSQEEVL